ncbi:MAG: ArsR/SmtB family transcription factor [Pirellulaceae bacterium]
MSPDKCSCIVIESEPRASRWAMSETECESTLRSSYRSGENLRDFVAITKALSDEQRVRVLLALQRGELCVCQIVELLGLATSTVSKHMSILKQARLVESRKAGRWMYYRLAGADASEVVRQALACTASSLAGDPQVLRDRQRLATICTSDPHELCVAQGSGKRACKQ